MRWSFPDSIRPRPFPFRYCIGKSPTKTINRIIPHHLPNRPQAFRILNQHGRRFLQTHSTRKMPEADSGLRWPNEPQKPKSSPSAPTFAPLRLERQRSGREIIPEPKLPSLNKCPADPLILSQNHRAKTFVPSRLGERQNRTQAQLLPLLICVNRCHLWFNPPPEPKFPSSKNTGAKTTPFYFPEPKPLCHRALSDNGAGER